MQEQIRWLFRRRERKAAGRGPAMTMRYTGEPIGGGAQWIEIYKRPGGRIEVVLRDDAEIIVSESYNYLLEAWADIDSAVRSMAVLE